MSFRTRRVLLGTPLYMIFEFIVLYYLFELYGGLNIGILVFFILILGLLQVVPMLFEEKQSTKLGRFLSTIFGIWEWVFVMLIIYLIVIYVLKWLFNIPLITVTLLLLTIPIIGIYSYYNAHRIVVKERVLTFDKLVDDYNILHLSDVHFGSIRHKKIIDDICKVLKAHENDCDLVIISGDLVDGSCVVEENDLVAFRQVNIPIIFTSGNHDYYPGLNNVHKACENAGIIILENEGIEFEDLKIYGLSYSFDDINMPSEKELEDFISQDKINIVNYHVPMGWNQLSDIGFDIQLSGHTHGGQFYPVIFFGNIMYEGHNRGLFKKCMDTGVKYLHVTTGVGSMDIPMRWGTNSEIVILKLQSE